MSKITTREPTWTCKDRAIIFRLAIFVLSSHTQLALISLFDLRKKLSFLYTRSDCSTFVDQTTTKLKDFRNVRKSTCNRSVRLWYRTLKLSFATWISTRCSLVECDWSQLQPANKRERAFEMKTIIKQITYNLVGMSEKNEKNTDRLVNSQSIQHNNQTCYCSLVDWYKPERQRELAI